MIQQLFKNAIAGKTVYIPAFIMLNAFVSATELQAWCTAFSLQSELTNIAGITTYKISKLI